MDNKLLYDRLIQHKLNDFHMCIVDDIHVGSNDKQNRDQLLHRREETSIWDLGSLIADSLNQDNGFHCQCMCRHLWLTFLFISFLLLTFLHDYGISVNIQTSCSVLDRLMALCLLYCVTYKVLLCLLLWGAFFRLALFHLPSLHILILSPLDKPLVELSFIWP